MACSAILARSTTADLKVDGQNVWRGLKTGGATVLSELDATQTLWIDVDSFVPRRYEFEYSSPGFGDYAYDLTFALEPA